MDELEVLRDLGQVDGPVPEVFERARAAFEDAAVGLGDWPATPPRQRRPRGRRRVLTAGTVAVGTAAAITALSLMPDGGITKLAVSPAAAAVLTQTANAAVASPPIRPGPGQYVYTVTTETLLAHGEGMGGTSSSYWYTETETTQTWIASDGSGRTRLSYTPAKFVSVADRQAWMKSGQPWPTSQPVEQSFGPSLQRVTQYLDPTGLPTDPSSLRSALARHYRYGDSPFGALTAAISLLQEPGISSSLRSAIFKALATTPGIATYGPITDATGRTGQAVGMIVDGVRISMIFDPTTATLLGEQKVVADPDALAVPRQVSGQQANAIRSERAGTVLDSVSFAAPQIVSSTHPVSPGS